MLGKPLLTIGMATSQDAFGVWQTITDLRIDHAGVMSYVEIVLVDDAPCSKRDEHECHAHAVQKFLRDSAAA